jgi:hypothetical protein
MLYVMYTIVWKGEDNDEETNASISIRERKEIELVFHDLDAAQPFWKIDIPHRNPVYNTHLFPDEKFKVDGIRDKFNCNLVAH